MVDVMEFFTRSLEIAARAGIARERIVLDPGIGFGKTQEQSMTRSRGSPSCARSACRC
jgi:dihydropteroate synthase